jgi:alpha-glucosidase (family GH31 glycosyl hydrolase)
VRAAKSIFPEVHRNRFPARVAENSVSLPHPLHSVTFVPQVVEFADAIRANGFNCSQLEIDDRWEPHYGELQFDLTKFPSPRALVESLRGRGMRTTLWVHPFINIDADTLQEAVSTKVYVGDPASTRVGQRPAFTTWWQGANAMIIDFTDSEGKAWFKNR